jgi:hypothetical protein
MDNISLGLIIAYSKPVLWVLALALGSVAVLTAFIANPKWPALGLFLIILTFINPSYGFLNEHPTDVYGWGLGKLPFPLIEFYLYGLFLAVLFRNLFIHEHPLKQAGGIWLVLFALMYLGHIAVGLTEVSYWTFVFNAYGLVHVLHMGMFLYIVVSVLDEEKDFQAFIKIFLVVAVGRAVFGLGRYVLLGGDPQNAYENFGHTNIKITFWDANEGLIASIAAFYFLWRLTFDWDKYKPALRWTFLICLGLEVLVVMLSFRRTNLLGFAMLGAYFLTLLPWRKRLIFAALGVFVLIPTVLAVTTYRAQETFGKENLSLMQIISPDASDSEKLAERGSRFYEWQVAFRSLEENPLLGIGMWNAFKVGPGDAYSLAYHRGNFQFIHSGFGHVLLKSGALGLTLFLGLLLATWRYAGRARRFVDPQYRALFESYRAGLWFMIPTLISGTPIIETRTMLWFAMVLAVPVAIARFSLPKTVPEPSRAGANLIAQPT